MRLRSYVKKLKLKLRLALRPLVETWDGFWVRNVDFYFGELTSEGEVVKLENRKDIPYLAYQDTNIKRHEFRVLYTEQDSYKKSFVCEKDLD